MSLGDACQDVTVPRVIDLYLMSGYIHGLQIISNVHGLLKPRKQLCFLNQNKED